MLKKVIFAAALAIGFMASYGVGTAGEGTSTEGASCYPRCGEHCTPYGCP